MKKLLLLFLVVSLPFLAATQPLSFNWVKAIGGQGFQRVNDIEMDEDGNSVICGYFTGNNFDIDPVVNQGTSINSLGAEDIFLAKIDSSGNLLWYNIFGSAGEDQAYGLTLDTSGNIYMVGSFSNTIDFNPGTGVTNLTSNGGQDVFYCKFNSAGGLVWAKSFGGISNYDIGFEIDMNRKGDIVMVGEFNGSATFQASIGGTVTKSTFGLVKFFMKIDELGRTVWIEAITRTGNSLEMSVAVDVSGNVGVVGSWSGTNVDFDPGPGTIYKTDNGVADVFVMRLNGLGALSWVSTFGGANWDSGYDVEFDIYKNLYVSGSFRSSVIFGTNITKTAKNFDGFICKYTSQGNMQWVQHLISTNTGYAKANNILLDSESNLIILGEFIDSVYLYPQTNPPNSVHKATSWSTWNVFVLKMDHTGNFIDAGRHDGSYAHEAAINEHNDIVSTGSYTFNRNVDFNMGLGVSHLNSNQNKKHYILKNKSNLLRVGFQVVKNKSSKLFSIYPNPSVESFTISLNSSEQEPIRITIRSMNGKLVYDKLVANNEVISHQLSAGAYFVSAESNNERTVKKLVVR